MNTSNYSQSNQCYNFNQSGGWQTTPWSKEKEHNTTRKTRDWATQTSLKTRGKLRCSWRVSSTQTLYTDSQPNSLCPCYLMLSQFFFIIIYRCLRPLITMFLLNHGSQFYRWRKWEDSTQGKPLICRKSLTKCIT